MLARKNEKWGLKRRHFLTSNSYRCCYVAMVGSDWRAQLETGMIEKAIDSPEARDGLGVRTRTAHSGKASRNSRAELLLARFLTVAVSKENRYRRPPRALQFLIRIVALLETMGSGVR